MSFPRRIGLIVGLTIGVASTEVVGQTCLGLPSFARGSVNLRGAFGTGNDVTSFGVGLQAGGRAVFAGGTVDYNSYNEFEESSVGASVNIGTQIPIGAAKRASICPVLEGSLGFGPDFDLAGEQWEVRSRAVLAGLAIGTNIDAGETVRVVPNAVAGVGYGGTKITIDGVELASGTSTYGVIRGGLGFLFNGTFGVTPFVSVPLGVDDADPSFGVWVSVALGRRQ